MNAPPPLTAPRACRVQAAYRRNRLRRAAHRQQEYQRWLQPEVLRQRRVLVCAVYAALLLFVGALAVLVSMHCTVTTMLFRTSLLGNMLCLAADWATLVAF
jgi:hypothetical protein